MAFSLRVDGEIVIGTCSGPIGLDDAKAGAKAVWDHPEWRGKPVVWDIRSAELKVAAADVLSLARFIVSSQPAPPPSKLAFVTGRDVDFGVVRMFGVYREHPATEFHAFRDYEEAVNWAREPGTG